MKPGAFLINAARGGLVDDAALLDALLAGRIAGAGLDTFVSEADPDYRAISQRLIELPNVIATPHAAASTREGLDRTTLVAAEIGRAPCGDRGGPTGEISVVAVSFKQKKTKPTH